MKIVMDDGREIDIESIKKTTIDPGDVIVLHTDRPLLFGEMDLMVVGMQRAFGKKVQVVFMNAGQKFEVVKRSNRLGKSYIDVKKEEKEINFKI